MNLKNRSLSLILGLGIIAVGIGQSSQPAPLKLKIGDQVKVVVLGFEQYTGDYTVLSDGSITGIGFGRIMGSGKTLAQVEAEIRPKLARYVRNPDLSVIMTQERLSQVFVVGSATGADDSRSVASGAFPLTPGMDLRQLLSLAPIPGKNDLFEYRVYRNGKLFKQIDPVALIRGEDSQWNGPLQANDMLAVTPVSLAKIWVLGMVKNPGEKRVLTGSNVYQAVASAGEVSANPNDYQELEVQIRRGPEVYTIPIKAAADAQAMIIENGDTILVQPPTVLKVSVGGLVNTPGAYEFRPGTALQTAVSAKGSGVADGGTLKNVWVLRGSEIFVVDATLTGSGFKPFVLENGDSIFVLKNDRIFHVLGEVERPGKIWMEDNREYRLVDALSATGGLRDRGSLRRAYVLSNEGGKAITRQYNLDEFLKDGKLEANPVLKPGDVVLFGQPKGITVQNASQLLSGALLVNSLFKN